MSNRNKGFLNEKQSQSAPSRLGTIQRRGYVRYFHFNEKVAMECNPKNAANCSAYLCVCVNDYPGTASQCIHMMHLYVLCISLHYVSVRGGQHFGRAGILDHSCTCSVPSICSAERGSKKYQQRRYLAQKHFVWKTSTGIRAKDESMFWALVSVLNPSPVSLVHPHLAEHCQDCTHHDDQAACRPQAEEMSQEIVF